MEKSGLFLHFLKMSKTTQKTISYAGTFERSMDAKNRVTIPAGWLNEGPDEFHAIPHSSGDCLVIMPPEDFDSIAVSIKQSERTPEDKQKIIRQIYSKARAVSADSQGRILLPEDQCGTLGLKGDIVLVGGHSRFEIWNTKRWSAISTSDEAIANEEAKQFGL